MKATIMALCAATFVAAAPAVLARDVPNKTPDLPHNVSKKHARGLSGHALREMQAKSANKRYPEAFGYAPGQVLDRETEMTRQAGGGGGGGGGM